jgi:hypothetical protein
MLAGGPRRGPYWCGCGPSRAPDRAGEHLREIGDAVGLTSISSVGYQLSALQRKGCLHRDGRRPRTTDLCLPSRPAVPPEQSHAAEAGQAGNGPDIPSREPIYVPLVGRIVADGPILAVSAEDLRIDLDDAQSCRVRRIGRLAAVIRAEHPEMRVLGAAAGIGG